MPPGTVTMFGSSVRVLVALAVLSSTAVLGVPVSSAATPPGTAQSTVGIEKSVLGLSGPATPGAGFEYELTASCSSLTVACQGATVSDVIPAALSVTELPRSNPEQTVTFDAASRLLTVTFVQPLPAPNPAGSTGLTAGSVAKIYVGVELPTSTTAADGSVITNTATIDASNATPASDSASVTVSIPRRLKPVATKSWPDADATAQSGAQSTITLGIANQSSVSAQVSSIAVSDTTAATFDTHDLLALGPVLRLPAGADLVTAAVCTQPVGVACTPAQWVSGAPTSGTALSLPAGIAAASVTGVRFTFSNSAGTPLPIDAVGGKVDFSVQLRNTTRSTGAVLDPTSSQTARNCAVPTAVDPVAGSATGTAACVSFSVLSRDTTATVAKQYFSDPAGNYTSSGRAVAGQGSGVSATTEVTNTSAFAVPSLSITEPSASTASDFADLDVSSLRLKFPAGATSAQVLITCRDGSTPAPITLTSTSGTAGVPATGCPSASPPRTITATFTGHDAQGAGSIAAGAQAQLGVHGSLNAGAPAGPVSNCADGAVTSPAGGQGSAAGVACANLTVYPPVSTVSGSKSGSANQLVAGVPVTFTLHASNSGNLPQAMFTLTDPPVPTAANNPFDIIAITTARLSTSPSSLANSLALQLYDSRSSTWVPYDGNDAALLQAARGIRVLLSSGEMPAGASITLIYSAVLRSSASAGATLTNCELISATAPGTTTAPVSACASQQTVLPPASSGAIQKAISPTTVPRAITGVPPQTSQVRIKVQNTGNIGLKRIVVTDTDAAFFDAVNLTGLNPVNFPPGANQVEVDACTTGCAAGTFIDGTPAPVAALPVGISAATVEGLRYTFSNSSGGYSLTGGSNFPATGPCPSASVCFQVAPRPTLRSDPATLIPDVLSNTATATGESALQPAGSTYPFGSATATLAVIAGTPTLDVSKTPTTSSADAGEDIAFTLNVKNTGTAAVTSLDVSDPVPSGLVFDDSFVGDAGQPFALTSTVPAGTQPLPAPTFTVVRGDPSDPSLITSLRWTFPGFDFLPGSTLAIHYADTLAPGFSAGQTETNVFGAGSDDVQTQQSLACTINSSLDGQTVDGVYGPGRYCTSSAAVLSRGGTDIDAQKWVTGDPSLDFYNTVSGTQVVPGAVDCPLYIDSLGRKFTRYPCVAQVLAGQRFSFVLRVTNAGNTPVTEVRLADGLPHTGDTGVYLSNEQRGTEWNDRPVLTGAPTLDGPGSVQLSYTGDAQVCTSELSSPPVGCPAGSWNPAYSASALGFEAFVSFPARLAPGASFTIEVPMQAPTDLSTPGDSLPIAWNSFAHTDFVLEPGTTVPVQLPLVEPPKVGVAMPFGLLQINKSVTGLADPGMVGPFEAAYSCAVTPAGGSPVVVASGTGSFGVGDPLLVPDVPVGASCSVWEPNAGGGQSAHQTQDTALVVTIAPAPGQATDVSLVNAFATGSLSVTKRVVNGAAGPYSFTMSCTLAGSALTLPAGTQSFTLTANQTRVFSLPAGAICTVTEVSLPADDVVSYGSSSSPLGVTVTGTPAETITNTFPLVAVAPPAPPAATTSPTVAPTSVAVAPPPPKVSTQPSTSPTTAVNAPPPARTTSLAYTGVNVRTQVKVIVLLMLLGSCLLLLARRHRRS